MENATSLGDPRRVYGERQDIVSTHKPRRISHKVIKLNNHSASASRAVQAIKSAEEEEGE